MTTAFFLVACASSGAAGACAGYLYGLHRAWTLATRLNLAVFDSNNGYGELQKLSALLKGRED